MDDQFIKPQYDSQCFSNLPHAIQHLLSGVGPLSLPDELFDSLPKRYRTIILFLIDSLGWQFIESRREKDSLLRRIAQDGVVSRSTCQFPSTTSPHVTTIHTGLSVGQSGIYEWQYYEPLLDAIIAPLRHSYAGEAAHDSLPNYAKPEEMYPVRTLYPRLRDHGVESFVFHHRDYAAFTFWKLMATGAEVCPYRTLPEVLVNMANLVLSRTGKSSYLYFYWDDIDTMCHRYGLGSPQLEAEIDTLLAAVGRLFLEPLLGKAGDALLILTADHGQVEVDPATTVYLNREPQFSGLQRFIRQNRKGKLLVPAGSCRDMFLYIKDESLDDALDFLTRRLEGRAEVYKTRDLIEKGFFGSEPVSPAFLARVGNLVILPYQKESVWWYEKGRFEQKYYGHHGGLTREEIEIPLLLCPL